MLEHLDYIPQTFLAHILKSSADVQGGRNSGCLLNDAKLQEKDYRALEKIVNNIRLVENYIYDPNRDNKDYQYQVTSLHPSDLRELLNNANAFSDFMFVL